MAEIVLITQVIVGLSYILGSIQPIHNIREIFSLNGFLSPLC